MRKLDFVKVIQQQLDILETIPVEPSNHRDAATRNMLQTCIKGMWICFTGTFYDGARSYPVTRERVVNALDGEDPTMNDWIEPQSLRDHAHKHAFAIGHDTSGCGA